MSFLFLLSNSYSSFKTQLRCHMHGSPCVLPWPLVRRSMTASTNGSSTCAKPAMSPPHPEGRLCGLAQASAPHTGQEPSERAGVIQPPQRFSGLVSSSHLRSPWLLCLAASFRSSSPPGSSLHQGLHTSSSLGLGGACFSSPYHPLILEAHFCDVTLAQPRPSTPEVSPFPGKHPAYSRLAGAERQRLIPGRASPAPRSPPGGPRLCAGTAFVSCALPVTLLGMT